MQCKINSGKFVYKMKRPKVIVKSLLFKTYIKVLRNSVGANTYRNFYALVDGKSTDILNDGVLSCAFFVSSILRIFGLIKEYHCTVDGIIKDLVKSGWTKNIFPKKGDIVVWEPETGDKNSHIGFYLGNELAISNSSSKKVPQIHHYTFNKTRKIIKIFTHPLLSVDTP